MTIEDGAVGTLINGVRQPIKLTKLTTTAPPADQDAEPATETFALRPDTGREAVPVDTPEVAADTGTWIEQRRAYLDDAPPVLPTWLRKADEFADATRWTAGYYAHLAAFHTVRAPIYLLRLVARSPRGAGRYIVRWAKWVADIEARPVEAEAAATRDITAWLALSRERTHRRS